MKYTLKKFFLKACIIIIAIYIAATSYKVYVKPVEPIIHHLEERKLTEHKKVLVISEDMVLGKLTAKAQIVSMEQQINKTETEIDDGLLGERHTKLTVHGTLKMGLETKDIHINYIDNDNGIVSVHLPKPKLISLELPYDKIDIDKTKGWARLSLNEEEIKNFYKSFENELRKEIQHTQTILDSTELHNQKVIEDIVKRVTGVKSVVFE